MTDNLESLEAELAAMRPRGLPSDLADRMAADLDGAAVESRWPDRFLLSAIGSGAIAACVIVSMLLKPDRVAPRAPAPTVAVHEPLRAGDYALAMARAAEFGP